PARPPASRPEYRLLSRGTPPPPPPGGGYSGGSPPLFLPATRSASMPDYTVIATWSFGQTAVKTAAPLLQAGQPALDAVIAGAQAVEDDPAVNSVGFGGLANAIGTVSLDACVMDGLTLNCGAVAGLENVRHAAAVARKVMEKT